MNKIVFYQERTFGDKFNVTFEFIKQNWKLLLRYFAYVVLPLSFVAEFFMEAMMKNVMTLATNPEELMNLIPSYGGFFLVSIAVYLWMGAVSFSLLQVYNVRPDGLQNIVFADFKPLLGRNAWRLVKSGLALSLVLLVVMILAGCLFALQMPVIAAVVYLVCMALMIPFVLFAPVYIFEDIPLWQAFARSFRLGWHTLGGILALGIVLMILTAIISFVCTLPWEICYLLKSFFVVNQGNADSAFNGVPFMLLQYLLGVLMMLARFLLLAIFYVSISYLYSHAAEKLDQMSVAEGVDHFEEMGDKNQDADDYQL